MMTSAITPPTRQRRKALRPAELTAAALRLFVEKGYATTRLDDVAAQAGVSKGTLYLYFDSKEALFKAVIEDAIVPVLDAGDDMLDTYCGTSADLLRELILVWWQRIGSTSLGGVTKLMISESRNFPEVAAFYHENVIQRGRKLMRRALQRGMDSGEFRRIEIEHAIDAVFAPALMMAIWHHSLGQCGCGGHDPAAYLDTVLDLALHGLIATPSSGN